MKQGDALSSSYSFVLPWNVQKLLFWAQDSTVCIMIMNDYLCSIDACTKKNDTEIGCTVSFGTPSRRKALATTEVHVRNGYRVLFVISKNSLVWFRLIDEKILRFSEGAASIVIPLWWFSLRFCQRLNRIGISSFCNVFLTGKTQCII